MTLSRNSKQAQLDRLAYTLARDFTLSAVQQGVSPDCLHDPTNNERLTPEQFLDGYLQGRWEKPPRSLTGNHGVYRRLLGAAQNKQGMPQTIKAMLLSAQRNLGVPATIWNNTKEYIGRLFAVLHGFDPKAVSRTYPYHDRSSLALNGQKILGVVIDQLQPSYTPRLEPRSHWVNYSKSIITAARFLSQFASFSKFDEYVVNNSQSVPASISLGRQFAREIHGIGLPLAWNFLKDAGYHQYAKPDVHVKDIFAGCGLSNSRDDVQVFEAIGRVANHNHTTPYAIDKLFWLIGSGNFHHHEAEIGGRKPEFIRYAKRHYYPVQAQL